MNQNDKKLSHYIDRLNAEKKPIEHQAISGTGEFDRLAETVRRVRTLKEPVMPDTEFEQRILSSLKSETDQTGKVKTFASQKKASKKLVKRTFVFATAAAAAAVLIFAVPNITLPGGHVNIAYAMEQAFNELKAYHGIIEVIQVNAAGEKMLQSKREVWADQKGNYYLKELEGYSQGMITVNNTKKEWQIRPEEEKVYLFPAFPDPYRFTFELGSEVEDVKNAISVKEVGEEKISGRDAVILEVTPDGGSPYHLWIDKETDLPLQRESAMQNALQYKITYTQIDFVDEIPGELLSYQPPKGYEEVVTNPEQPVSTLEEAEDLAGFVPVIPENIPEGYSLKGIAVLTDKNAIKLYYGTTDPKQTAVILQLRAEGEMVPDSKAVLGTVNNNTAEVLSNYQGMNGVESLRWQENEMEYTVFGNMSLENITMLAKGLTKGEIQIPSDEEVTIGQPQIEVPVDMEAEENDQKSVDAGHSPWRLDPVFVSQVFASLLLSPEGIVGDYPIAYEDIKITENNGIEAIAEINSEKSIAKYVYLKRLIRQDDTGIWTVVGYDPMK